jgi:hypothetical protein
MPQCRRGIPTEYKALKRLFLNEGHSHETTELKLLFLNEGSRIEDSGSRFYDQHH